MDPYKILGVSEGSIKGKTDLERVRQRSKELYKRLAQEKKESQAKRVLEAFEVIKVKFKKQEAGGRTGSDSSNRKPETSTSAVSGSDGQAALRRHSSHASDKGKKSTSSSSRKQESSAGKSSSSSRKTAVTAPDEKASKKKDHGSKAPENGAASTIRNTGVSLFGRKIGAGAVGNGLHKKRTAEDLLENTFKKQKHEAAVQPVQVHNVEADKKARLTCKCGANFSAQRFQRGMQLFSLDAGAFKCPACRVREMDPFNVVAKGSQGMLNMKLVQKPVVPETASSEASFKFKLNLPQIKEWRKSGDNIEVRMCRLDSYDAHQAWPHSMIFKVNGKKIFSVKEPQVGHKRRDIPKKISPYMKPGVNSVEVSLKDEYVQRYAIALVRTSPQVPRDLTKQIPYKTADKCKQHLVDLMFSSQLEGCVEDFQSEVADRSRLVCPITLEKIKTPARGRQCKHLQCFDLEAYLVSNQRISAFNKRWHCPVCDLVLKPPNDLLLDAYHLKILAETGDRDEEVAFDSFGAWKVTYTADSPAEPSSDEEFLSTAPPQSSPQSTQHGTSEQLDEDSSDIEVEGVDDISTEVEDDSDVEQLDDKAEGNNAEEKEGEGAVEIALDEQPVPSPEPLGSPGSEEEEAHDCQTDPYLMDDDMGESLRFGEEYSRKQKLLEWQQKREAERKRMQADEESSNWSEEEDQPAGSTSLASRALDLIGMVATPAPLQSPGDGSDKEDTPARRNQKSTSKMCLSLADEEVSDDGDDGKAEVVLDVLE